MEDGKKFEKLEPIKVEALDEILGIPFKVLDDGFVRVVDYLGSDQSIVQAARVSYGKGTKKNHLCLLLQSFKISSLFKPVVYVWIS